MKKTYIILIGLLVFLFACGEGDITIDYSKYEPKIVIDGYIYPGKPVDQIKITRNLPLNTNIDKEQLVLSEAVVVLTDLTVDPNQSYPLSFNQDSLYYYYDGIDLTIESGSKYRLEIQANVEGKSLTASSTTTVPLPGFMIIDSESTQELSFSDITPEGKLPRPVMTFIRSDQTDFYVFSLLAVDASLNSFIYDLHPWSIDIKPEDVEENFDTFRKSHDTIFNTPQVSDTTQWVIDWFHMWFYGQYRIIAYAGDENMKNYYLTHANVAEMDGNLHEPVFNIDGDGIGIFGSAIADTLYFTVLQ